MNWKMLFSLVILITLLGGCGGDHILNVYTNDEGVAIIPPSDQTGNMRILADIPGRTITVTNQNAEVVGVRIYRDSYGVLFSDGLIGAGESSTSENINIQLETEYQLKVVFYEFNPIDILTNLLNYHGEQAWWEHVMNSYVRSELNTTIIFRQ